MIDVDDPSTWPDRVRAWVEPFAETLRGTTDCTTDLAVPLEDEEEFRSVLADEKLLVDHYTRLLDHEVERVEREGLQPLTAELLVRRITNAETHGALNHEVAALLVSGSLVETGHSAGRMDKVCVVIGRRALDSSAVGCDDQLAVWGGEAIYRSSYAIKELVRGIGRPTMVATLIDVSTRNVLAFPPLSRLFVGSLLNTQPPYGEVHVAGGVPALDIVGVYQPGDTEYDRHAGLPRI